MSHHILSMSLEDQWWHAASHYSLAPGQLQADRSQDTFRKPRWLRQSHLLSCSMIHVLTDDGYSTGALSGQDSAHTRWGECQQLSGQLGHQTCLSVWDCSPISYIKGECLFQITQSFPHFTILHQRTSFHMAHHSINRRNWIKRDWTPDYTFIYTSGTLVLLTEHLF